MVGVPTSLIGRSSWLFLALALAACSGDKNGDRDGTGGSTSSGGSTGMGGSSTASGGSGGAGTLKPYVCDKKVAPDTAEMTATIAPGGKWGGTGFNGGSFTYGDGPDADKAADITMTFENASLNLKGTVPTYSGFGLWFGAAPGQTVPCIDASAYTGVSFHVVDNAGTAASLQVSIQAHKDAPIDVTNKRGECVWTSDTTKFSECFYPNASAAVPAGGGEVQVPFADFKGGKPVDTVDPTELDGVQFQFPWTEGMAAYDVDLTLKDLKFY
jgi:hypothetical protein